MTAEAVAHVEGSSPTARTRAPGSFGRLLESYALVLLLIALMAFFALWPKTSDTFLTLGNMQILVGNQAVLAVIAIAALIPLIANEWDLSVGATAGLSSIIAAQAMSDGHGPFVATLEGLLVGLAVGAVTAFVVTKVGVNGIITTLGLATVLAGVTNQVTGGRAINTNIPDTVIEFGLGTFLEIPKIVFALLAVIIVAWYCLERTPYGRYLYAIGSNASAAKLVGIRVPLVIGASFFWSALLSSAGGVMQVARQAGADPRVSASFTLPALAAAFLSAAAIKPGTYNVMGTVVAIFFLAVLNNGLNLAGVPDYVSSYVNGTALIVGVALAAVLGRRRL